MGRCVQEKALNPTLFNPGAPALPLNLPLGDVNVVLYFFCCQSC